MSQGQEQDGVEIAASIDDPARFAVIFDRHFDAINVYLRRQLDEHLADDLSSQTFLVAFGKRDRFDPSYESARPWLYGIAANLVRNHHREVRRRLRAYARTGVETAADPLEGSEERLDAIGLRPELAAAMAKLKKQDLETLLLFAWEELSYQEIAEALEVPTGTVRSRINRARKQLREPLSAERPSTSKGLVPSTERASRWMS